MPSQNTASKNVAHRNFNSRRVLFDTNTLLDALDEARPESLETCKALEFCNGGGDMGLATSGSLKDVYYILRKRFDEEHARICIRALLDLLVILPVGAEECIMAVHSNEPDFEDGQLRAGAELNDVAFILTRDKDAYRNSHIRTITCSEYLRIISSESRCSFG